MSLRVTTSLKSFLFAFLLVLVPCLAGGVPTRQLRGKVGKKVFGCRNPSFGPRVLSTSSTAFEGQVLKAKKKKADFIFFVRMNRRFKPHCGSSGTQPKRILVKTKMGKTTKKCMEKLQVGKIYLFTPAKKPKNKKKSMEIEISQEEHVWADLSDSRLDTKEC